ncbi:metallophosphoesterase [candidate division WOR-3 bacterium]|nr:metallophosphoesterase [candidate division WOR-3 bacterium]
MEDSFIKYKRCFKACFLLIIIIICLYNKVLGEESIIRYPKFGINACRKSTDTISVHFKEVPDSFKICNNSISSKWYKPDTFKIYKIEFSNIKEGIYNITSIIGEKTVIEKHCISIKDNNNFKDFIRVIFITDCHIGFRHTAEKLVKWVDIINKENPDIVIFGGDNIEYNNSNYLEEFMKITENIKCPFLMISGNHEHHNFLKMSIGNRTFKDRINEKDHFHEAIFPLSIYLFDTRSDNYFLPSRCKGPSSVDIKWADNLLASDNYPYKAFVMHGPPVDHTELNQRNNDAILTIAEKHSIDFILCGHTHKSVIYDKNMKMYNLIDRKQKPLIIQTGTCCKTFIPFAEIRRIDFYTNNDSISNKILKLKEN